jgi:hypothetical protein
MSKSSVFVAAAAIGACAPATWAANADATDGRYAIDAGVRYAGDGGNEFSLGASVTSANGWLFDIYGARMSDAESNGVEFDPRYWSIGFGKEFAASGWRANLGFAGFDDGVQVETQDVNATLAWGNDAVNLSLDASVGDADEVVEIVLSRGGTRLETLTTDRTGFGISGSVNAGEYLTLSAGFRTYDYDSSVERLAALPRLQQYLIANVFTAQQGLVDSSWSIGAAAYLGSVTVSIDFAQSEELNGDGTSDDARIGIEIPLASRWQVTLGAGYFSSSGVASADDGSSYGSLGLRFTNR